MDRSYQRRKFTELRLQYYVAGRMLWFNDSMETGSLVLGYAIESHIKHAINEFSPNAPAKLLFKHDFLELFEYCRKNDIFNSLTVADDLLYFVKDRFHQRYPLQAMQSEAEATERGHAICLSLDLIQVYDQFIADMDDWISDNLADSSSSIGLMASHFVNRNQGRVFYHCNVPAHKRLPSRLSAIEREYKDSESNQRAEGRTEETIRYNLANQELRMAALRGGTDELWIFKSLQTRFTLPNLDDWVIDLSAFQYPGKTYRP